MKPGIKRPRCAVGVIEGPNQQILIARPGEQGTPWQLPRSLCQPGESPEAAMRRLAPLQLGIEVNVHIGQPPVVVEFEGEQVELRCFFCDIKNGTPTPKTYSEIRWVMKSQLIEYDFDAITMPIIEWIVRN